MVKIALIMIGLLFTSCASKEFTRCKCDCLGKDEPINLMVERKCLDDCPTGHMKTPLGDCVRFQ